jgi:hypothetical protein
MALLLWLVPFSQAQLDKISIAAGTPEDKALNDIAKEQDAQKKISMYEDFLKTYASNPMAVAYGNWQLSQMYQTSGDLQKAEEYGDKAAAASPRNLDILTSEAMIAQQLKDNARMFKYSIQGGQAYDSIDTQKKLAGVSDEQFASDVAAEKDANKSTYQFFQNAAFNVIAGENDAKIRMDDIDQFTATFPKSGLDEQLNSYALLSLSELKDNKRMVAYGEKALAANPDNLAVLVTLANTFAESSEPANLARAATYAQRAIVAAKADEADADNSRKVSAGVAHSVLGRVYAQQQKTPQSITELKSATALLKERDDQQFALAAYYLGWDYAKLNRLGEARTVLNEVVAIAGPVQGPAKELLTKVNSARTAGR